MNYNTFATTLALVTTIAFRFASPTTTVEKQQEVGPPRTLCQAIYQKAIDEVVVARTVEELNALEESASVLAEDVDPDCRAAAELTARVANSVMVEPDLALLDF